MRCRHKHPVPCWAYGKHSGAGGDGDSYDGYYDGGDDGGGDGNAGRSGGGDGGDGNNNCIIQYSNYHNATKTQHHTVEKGPLRKTNKCPLS